MPKVDVDSVKDENLESSARSTIRQAHGADGAEQNRITNSDQLEKPSKATDSPKPKVIRSSKGVDIKDLLEAGAHFGHQTSRWHPKMGQYIHSKRAGNHIIDLTKTAAALETALAFLNETAASGKQILLVGTKRQAKEPIKAVATVTKMPYVSERWLGGMLTNQNTIGGRIKHLKDIETRLASGELAARYNKLEVQRFGEEIEEMNHLYGGIKEMSAKPGAVFVIDVLTDINAVREAKKLHIPVVALTDTNVDPGLVDYAIPSNDDATKTINLILEYVQQAIEDGLTRVKKAPVVDKPDEGTEEAPKAEKPKEEAEVIAPVQGIG